MVRYIQPGEYMKQKNIFVLESQIYSCLSHPKRLEILHLLSEHPRTVMEIVKLTQLSQSNVSQHLALLKKMDLVVCEKDAQHRVYHLRSKEIQELFARTRRLILESLGVQEVEAINRLQLHVDPVCGMELTVKAAASSVVHDHHRYYFCGYGCEKQFRSTMHSSKEITL